MLADRVRMGLSQDNGVVEALVSCYIGQQVFRILDEEEKMLLQVSAGQSDNITLEVGTPYYLLTYGPYGAYQVREDIRPDYDEETQYLANDGYEILEDKVIKKYRIEEISEREEPRDLEAEIEELRQTIDVLLGGEDNE